jgi:hypothetical protein
MKRCNKCRIEAPEDALYCPQCGSKIGGKKGKRRLLGVLATLTATAVLVIQFYAAFAGIANKPVAPLLTEAGYPYYVENGVIYVVVTPELVTIESVARLAGKNVERFGYSTCQAPAGKYLAPLSLDARTKITDTRLGSAVEEVWMAGMGKSSSISALYNGTHAIITLTVTGVEPPSILAALSSMREDVCVRVLVERLMG